MVQAQAGLDFIVDQGQANLIVTNVTTIMVVALYPTNEIVNFQKVNFRVPGRQQYHQRAWAGPRWSFIWNVSAPTASAITLNYRVNNFLNNDADANEERNNLFPLQPGSDYAVPTPPTHRRFKGPIPILTWSGTISFPSGNGGADPISPSPLPSPMPASQSSTRISKSRFTETITVNKKCRRLRRHGRRNHCDHLVQRPESAGRFGG